MKKTGILEWGIDDFYKQYICRMSALKKKPLSRDKYIAGFEYYLKELQRHIIRGGYVYNMHYGLGVKTLAKKKRRDFSDGNYDNLKYTFEIFWRKDVASSDLHERYMYLFTPCKGDGAVNGQRGVKKWQLISSKDPFMPSMDAILV